MMSESAGLEEVKNYLRQLEFKKSMFGGCNKEDVLQKIHTVTMMFREQIAGRDEELEELRQKLETLDRDLTASMQAAAEREAALAACEAEYQRISQEMVELQARAGVAQEYEEKSRVLMEELVRVERDRGSILGRAESEARKIVLQAEETAREHIRRLRRESETEQENKRRELMAVSQELESLKDNRIAYMQELKITMRLISEEIGLMQEKTQNLFNRASDDLNPGMYVGEDGMGEPQPMLSYNEAVNT